MKARLILAFAMAVAAAPLSAQDNSDRPNDERPDLVPGSRVRFSMLDAGGRRDWSARQLVVRGTLTDIRTDSLVMNLGGSATRLTVARSALANLEVSRGMVRGWRVHPYRTAASGLIAAGSVALFISAANTDRNSSLSGTRTAPALAPSTVISMFLFAKTALTKTEKWEPAR